VVKAYGNCIGVNRARQRRQCARSASAMQESGTGDLRSRTGATPSRLRQKPSAKRRQKRHSRACIHPCARSASARNAFVLRFAFCMLRFGIKA
jgi:hypothetical protein